ncbi:hypothetical protein BTA51_02475 [Hahella sp. CCB-MM4]|uniref:hypothetical protein n=1 Tax=Hahella sp. (strain CCB-MM4) TaxID=1926491 RepID=UPI000B9B671F|nr:hypothetical protein [Hahella sp. CCB-MM4]OZG75268.1 hypothetical protein BTA51_02475 [Hahella sp. CCB-MM4]
MMTEIAAMSSQILQYNKRLERLYSNKMLQLNRALNSGNKLRCLVLQAEADAICQELKQIAMAK